MATRSYICYKDKDGAYKCAYCHYDGYPEYVGVLLDRKYKTLSKIKKLVDLGGFSSLEETVSKTSKGKYTDEKKRVFKNIRSMKGEDVEYAYYYNPSLKKWFFVKYNISTGKSKGTYDLSRYLRYSVYPYLKKIINLYEKGYLNRYSLKDLLDEIKFREKYLSKKQKEEIRRKIDKIKKERSQKRKVKKKRK